MPAYMEPRRRSEAVNVGRPRPVSRVRVIEEEDQMTWGDRRLDRNLQSRHTLELRQYRRDVEAAAAEAARNAADAAAIIENLRKYFDQCKEQEFLAWQRSESLAAGNMALTANFSHYDEALHRASVLLGMDFA
jgi:hypothetical protein